jgi:predicted metal-dependent peptidase
MLTAREKMSAAIMRVVEPPVALAPYFGAVLRGLVRREAPGLGTLGVTKDGVLLWDAAFVEKTDVVELAGVLVHEVMHVVLKHHDRMSAMGIVPEPTPDAQAAAYLGNIACFPAGTLVGDTPIETLTRGANVLGADGAWGDVVTPMAKRFSGDLCVIRASSCQPIEATSEHPVLVSKRAKKGYPIRLRDPEWVQAGDVTVGDYVYFGVPTPQTETTVLPIDEAWIAERSDGRRSGRSALPRTGFPLTVGTAWLLGLWTAEGSGGESCTLSLGPHERVLAERAIAIAETLGYKASYSKERTALKVRIGSSVLSRAMQAWCGRGAKNKRVPAFIITHGDAGIREAFLNGLAAGDGYYGVSKMHHSLGVASRQLIAGTQLLLSTFGRFGWSRVAEQKEGRMLEGRALPAGTLYTLGWSDKKDAGTRVLNGSTIRSHSRRWRQTPHGIAVPVVEVSRRHHVGQVYNMATTTHTYTAGGLVVHNCDLAINTELAKNVKLPGDYCMPEKFKMPPNLTFEEYYALLQKQVQKQQAKGGGSGDDGQGDGQDGKGNGKPAAGGGWCGSCAGHPMPGEPADGKKNEDGRSEADMERFRKQVAQDIQATKDRGTIPASLNRFADELLAPPKIDWRTKLARVLRGAVAYKAGQSDFTWSKMSRRQAGVGFGVGRPVIPALHSPVPSVGVIVDTSGSVSAAGLAAAASEIQGILSAVGASVTVVAVDAAVQEVKECKTIADALKSFKGGGGTIMTPGFEALEAMKNRPSVIVCMTDGCIGDGYPEVEPSWCKTIWVVIEGADQPCCPWGEFIHVEADA